jgi:hypothetical protein
MEPSADAAVSRNEYRPGLAAARPSRPFQEMLCTSSGATACGVHVLTTVPSAALTSSTLSDVAEAPDRRKENFTPGRASTNALVRLVPVSSRGAPARRGPGTGESSGFGSGGSGGRISTGFDGCDLPPEAVVSEIGPVTAPSGTRACTRVLLPARTLTVTSSPLP